MLEGSDIGGNLQFLAVWVNRTILWVYRRGRDVPSRRKIYEVFSLLTDETTLIEGIQVLFHHGSFGHAQITRTWKRLLGPVDDPMVCDIIKRTRCNPEEFNEGLLALMDARQVALDIDLISLVDPFSMRRKVDYRMDRTSTGLRTQCFPPGLRLHPHNMALLLADPGRP